ncbi:EAL domain-containing protein [Roseospirillum parvum]|uniref:EAL domain, c-di-GMP-specific phosphodiesterase class I (Or its enzymatically inactive variant) n=1 Tax=Roseospirillum parvum TaxID=83401 RepID=A0A1G8E2T0_9PROT|nr:EAL domain-containing protein [Roseospirillum parvum]SDH64184.1 EAL domain, c-di-GMP-specific phosphodiesterase class I (or its enzymatically inactive variant) [Roseospirillum parvum]
MSASLCPRCECVPDAPGGNGRLLIWTPLGHTSGKLERALTAAAIPAHTDGQDACLIARVGNDDHTRLAALLDDALTRAECRDSRVLFLPDGTEPGRQHLGQVMGLDAYAARARGGWLLDLIAAERVTTLFQPIFHVSDPSRIFAHECLLRGVGPDGAMIPPGAMFDTATRADLIFPLDRLARTTHVANASAKGLTGHVFINFTPSAVYDPAFCLRTTVAAVERAGLARERVVFEVVETEQINDPDHLANVLRHYRNTGFKVALDDLGGGYSTLGLLPSLQPDFIKLDRGLVDGVHNNPVQATIIQRLIQLAHDLGIRIVAEGIERAEDLAWLKASGADFVQGFLLARPAADPLPPATT